MDDTADLLAKDLSTDVIFTNTTLDLLSEILLPGGQIEIFVLA